MARKIEGLGRGRINTPHPDKRKRRKGLGPRGFFAGLAALALTSAPHITLGVQQLNKTERAALEYTEAESALKTLYPQSMTADIGNQAERLKRHLKSVITFSSEKVIGAETLTRRDYIRTHLKDTMIAVPERLHEPIARLAVGLASQESGFDNSVKSGAGATHIFQIMPATAAESGYVDTEAKRKLLRNQVAFAGAHFGRIYQTLQNEAGPDLQYLRDTVYQGKQDVFEREFLIPLMITSYNAGQGTMERAVGVYVDMVKAQKEAGEIIEVSFVAFLEYINNNNELFPTVGKDVLEYARKVYAWTLIVEAYEKEQQALEKTESPPRE